MSTLILLCYEQSTWNLENRFTGTVDVDLTMQGELEASSAAAL
jgi:2,3-bisphosphoglycerate-dependent phosphoglycerate mutase